MNLWLIVVKGGDSSGSGKSVARWDPAVEQRN